METLSEQSVIDRLPEGEEVHTRPMMQMMSNNFPIPTRANYPPNIVDGQYVQQAFLPQVMVPPLYSVRWTRIVPLGDEDYEAAMKRAVRRQPIYGRLRATVNFRTYEGGVYRINNNDRANHAVDILAYDVEPDGEKVWVLQHAYRTARGEKGYMKMLRGGNLCSIEECAYYPTFV